MSKEIILVVAYWSKLAMVLYLMHMSMIKLFFVFCHGIPITALQIYNRSLSNEMWNMDSGFVMTYGSAVFPD